MRTKVTQLSVTVPPELKQEIWGEASRLHTNPSRWVREVLWRSVRESRTTNAPDEYVITLTEKQAVELRKQGYRIDFHPIPEEA